MAQQNPLSDGPGGQPIISGGASGAGLGGLLTLWHMMAGNPKDKYKRMTDGELHDLAKAGDADAAEEFESRQAFYDAPPKVKKAANIPNNVITPLFSSGPNKRENEKKEMFSNFWDSLKNNGIQDIVSPIDEYRYLQKLKRMSGENDIMFKRRENFNKKLSEQTKRLNEKLLKYTLDDQFRKNYLENQQPADILPLWEYLDKLKK